MPTKQASLADMDARPSASHSALWNLLCQILMNAAGMVTGVLVARTLGVTGRGEYGALNIPTTLAGMLLTLGNGYSLIHYVPRGLRKDKLVANVVWFSLAVGAVGVAIIWIVIPSWMKQYSDQARHCAQLTALTIPAGLIANLGLSVAIGREDYKSANALRVMPRLLTATAFLICWIGANLSLTNAVIINIGVSVILGVVTLLCLGRGQRNEWLPDWNEIKRLQSYGVKIIPGTLVALTNLRLDQIFMVGLLAPSALGLYTVSVTVSELLGIFGGAFTNLLEGRGANAEPEHAKQFFQKSTRITLLVTTVLAVLMGLSAQPVIVLVYGVQFKDAGLLVQVLCLGTIAQVFNRNAGGFLSGAGHPWADSVAQGVALAATVVLIPTLLRSQGVLGAAVASDIAYFAATIVFLTYIKVRLNYDTLSTLIPNLSDIHLLARHLQKLSYAFGRDT